MAENKCIARAVAGKPYTIIYADHHEWRFLRQRFIANDLPSPSDLYCVYYCIFCLKLENRKVE